MDVSHFELVWKRQSPATPIGQSGIDKVFQGYFLEITNLEPVSYRYALEFVAAPAALPERSLAGNTVVFIDTPGVNNAPAVLTGNIGSTVFRLSTGPITIPPNTTALVAVLPSAFANLPTDPTPLLTSQFEVRGFVRLRLPPVFKVLNTPLGPQFVYGPQSNAPVKVMLTPQNRSTYYTEAGALSDQTQSSLPTASGTAVNMLPPDRPFFFPPLFESLDVASLSQMDAMIAPEDRSTVMAAMLASMGEDPSDLAKMNAGLAKAGIGLALERRKVKA